MLWNRASMLKSISLRAMPLGFGGLPASSATVRGLLCLLADHRNALCVALGGLTLARHGCGSCTVRLGCDEAPLEPCLGRATDEALRDGADPEAQPLNVLLEEDELYSKVRDTMPSTDVCRPDLSRHDSRDATRAGGVGQNLYVPIPTPI